MRYCSVLASQAPRPVRPMSTGAGLVALFNTKKLELLSDDQKLPTSIVLEPTSTHYASVEYTHCPRPAPSPLLYSHLRHTQTYPICLLELLRDLIQEGLRPRCKYIPVLLTSGFGHASLQASPFQTQLATATREGIAIIISHNVYKATIPRCLCGQHPVWYAFDSHTQPNASNPC